MINTNLQNKKNQNYSTTGTTDTTGSCTDDFAGWMLKRAERMGKSVARLMILTERTETHRRKSAGEAKRNHRHNPGALGRDIGSIKKIMGVILFFMLSLLSLPVFADIEAISASSSLDSSHQASNMIDQNSGTSWMPSSVASGGWIDIEFDSPSRIYQLGLQGQIQADIIDVLYFQNNQYKRYTAGTVSNVSNESIFILTNNDELLTDKIRLNIKGTGSSFEISEISVVNEAQDFYYRKLKPLSIEEDGNYPLISSAEKLMDGDLSSYWQSNSYYLYNFHPQDLDNIIGALPGNFNHTAEFNLVGPSLISLIKLYFRENAKGLFKVYLCEGSSESLVFQTTDPTSGWMRIHPSTNQDITKIKITVDGTDMRTGGIAEAEFWGYGKYPDLNNLRFDEPQNISSKFILNFDASEKKEFELQIATQNINNTNLEIKVNQLSFSAFPSSVLNGNEIYGVTIPASAIWQGNNYIEINGYSNLNLLNVNFLWDKFYEPFIQWNNSMPTGMVDLACFMQLETTRVVKAGNADIDSLEYGYWNDLINGNNQNLLAINSTGNNIERINIIDPPQSAFELYGSQTAVIQPEVRIVWPPVDALSSTLPLETNKLILYTPDSTTNVYVNGILASFFSGNSHFKIFSFEDVALMPRNYTTLAIRAVDSQSRVNEFQVTVPPFIDSVFTIDQDDEVITSDDTFVVSGTIQPGYTIQMQGNSVTLYDRIFFDSISLSQGMNLIEVNALLDGTVIERKLLRVIKTSDLDFEITSPKDGTYQSTNSYIIEGIINGYGPFEVEIDGASYVFQGNFFSSQPVFLCEGLNNISIYVQDAAGNSLTKNLTLYYDSKSPIINLDTAIDGISTNQSSLNISGSIIDDNSVSVSLYMNGIQIDDLTLDNGCFDYQLNLENVSEGDKEILLMAIDIAGNLCEKTIIVHYDITPPNKFNLYGIPDGWSNNKQPEIYFSTADNESGSGLSHYVLMVYLMEPYEEDVEIYGEIVTEIHYNPLLISEELINMADDHLVLGPYDDGKYVIQMLAFDKAGNIIVSSVNYLLDSIKPNTPNEFKVVAGVEKAILTWEDDGAEFQSIQIYRDDIILKELFRDNQNLTLFRYVDKGLVDGSSHAYQIKAVDKAGNASDKSAAISVTIGIENESIDETGGKVAFENLQVTIPEEQFNTGDNIVITICEDVLPENPFALSVGDAFNIQRQDNAGNIIDEKFSDYFELAFAAYDFEIPSGYSFFDVGIYYWNETGENWELLEDSYYDLETNLIRAQTTHFSIYKPGVMLNTYSSRNTYNLTGFTTSSLFFNKHHETVSTQSGALIVGVQDLFLSGPDGFDLSIGRTYSSTDAEMYARVGNLSPVDTFALGWNLDIPWIETHENGKYIRFESGVKIKIDWTDNVFIYHNNGTYFELEKTGSEEDAEYTLYLKNGITYTFDYLGRVTRKMNVSKLFIIKYKYSDSNPRELKSIVDPNGRIVNFSYETKPGNNLDVSDDDIRVINEIYYMVDGNDRRMYFSYSDIGELERFEDFKSNVTIYNYESIMLEYGREISDSWYDRTQNIYYKYNKPDYEVVCGYIDPEYEMYYVCWPVSTHNGWHLIEQQIKKTDKDPKLTEEFSFSYEMDGVRYNYTFVPTDPWHQDINCFQVSLLKQISFSNGGSNLFSYDTNVNIVGPRTVKKQESGVEQSEDANYCYKNEWRDEYGYIVSYHNTHITVTSHTQKFTRTLENQQVESIEIGNKYFYTFNETKGSITDIVSDSQFIPANTYITKCRIEENNLIVEEKNKIIEEEYAFVYSAPSQMIVKEVYKTSIKSVLLSSKYLPTAEDYQEFVTRVIETSKPCTNFFTSDVLNVIPNNEFLGVVLKQRVIKDQNENVFDEISFGYNLETQQITCEHHTRGNYDIIFDYDEYGNSIYFKDQRTGKEIKTKYHNLPDNTINPNIKNLIDFSIETDTVDNNNVTTHYYYEDLEGQKNKEFGKPNRITIESINLDTESTEIPEVIEISMDYNDKGLLEQTIKNGITTKYEYDSFNYPDKISLTGIKENDHIIDNDGNQISIIETYYDYSQYTGLLEQVTDSHGMITKYKYDTLNRLTNTSYWDGDIELWNKNTDIDDVNNITTTTDQRGHQRVYAFDPLGRLDLIKEKVPVKNLLIDTATDYIYDNFGRLSEVIKNDYEYDVSVKGTLELLSESKKIHTVYKYDNFDRIHYVIYPDAMGITNSDDDNMANWSPYVRLEYNDAENIVEIYNEANELVSREKSDWAGRLIECLQDTGNEKYLWKYNYNSKGSLISSSVDILQEDNILESHDLGVNIYNGYGKLMQSTSPGIDVWNSDSDNMELNQTPVQSFEYDKWGNIIHILSPAMNIMEKSQQEEAKPSIIYNRLNMPIASIQKYQENGLWKELKSETFYNNRGQIVKTQDINENGEAENILKYCYSERGNLKAVIDPENNAIYYEYNQFGDLIAVTDPEGVSINQNNDIVPDNEYTTFFEYDDEIGYLSSTFYPDEADDNDNITNHSDNPCTSVVYDHLGRVLLETDMAGVSSFYTYTPRGNLETISIINSSESNNVDKRLMRTYIYDMTGKVSEIVQNDAENSVFTEFEYDQIGRLIKSVDGKGSDDAITEEYAYDVFNNLTRYLSGKNYLVANSYNRLGWITNVKQYKENISNIDIDLQNFQAPDDYDQTQYFYDINGNPNQVIKPNGLSYNYEYDNLNRMKTVFDSLKQPTKFFYDDLGRLKQKTDVKNINWLFEYFKNGNLKNIQAVNSDNEAQYFASQNYDKAGRIEKLMDSSSRIIYDYNPRGDLSSEIQTIGGHLIDDNTFYGGKLYTKKYDYNEKGQLVDFWYPESSTSLNFKYNDFGLVDTITDFTLEDGILYDNALRLESLTTNSYNPIMTHYDYDDLGRLKTAQTDNILYQKFEYDKHNNIFTIQIDPNSEDATKKRQYNYDYKDQLVDVRIPNPLLEKDPTPTELGVAQNDFLPDNENYSTTIDFSTQNLIIDSLNQAISLNLDPEEHADIKKILIPNINYFGITLDDLMICYSIDGNKYTEVDVDILNSSINDNCLEIDFSKNINKMIIKIIKTGIDLEYLENFGHSLQLVIQENPVEYLGGFNLVKLDYAATSIGIKLPQYSIATRVKKIEFQASRNYKGNKIEADPNRFIELYYSTGGQYINLDKSAYSVSTDQETGKIDFTLTSGIEMTELKIHCVLDDRNGDYQAQDRAVFINTLARMVKVYLEGDVVNEHFEYDANGNRIKHQIDNVQSLNYESKYYKNTDWLKTDGKYAFTYDAVGNETAKGNYIYVPINGDKYPGETTEPIILPVSDEAAQEYIRLLDDYDTIEFVMAGENVELYTYIYDVLNRLVEVDKSGVKIVDYVYNVLGLRTIKNTFDEDENPIETIHYIYEGTSLIFEKRFPADEQKDAEIINYVYAFGKHFAKVEGSFGADDSEVSYYHTDHLGSVRAMSDSEGNTLWEGEYSAFGELWWSETKTSDDAFQAPHIYAGKTFEEETGLYYFNVRWMDPTTGRFLSEDPIKDGLNWFGYVGNNPNNFIDPTGGSGRTVDDYHNMKMEGMTQKQRRRYCLNNGLDPNTESMISDFMLNYFNQLNSFITGSSVKAPAPNPDFDFDYSFTIGVDGEQWEEGWNEVNGNMCYVWREDGRSYSTVYKGVKFKEGSSSTDDPIIVETTTVVITERGVTQKDGDKPRRSEPAKIDSKKLRDTIITVASKPENLSDPDADTWACDTVFYEIEELMEFDIRRYFDRSGPEKDITTNIIFNLVKRAKSDPSILQLNELEAQRYANNDYLVIGLWMPNPDGKWIPGANNKHPHYAYGVRRDDWDDDKVKEKGVWTGGGGYFLDTRLPWDKLHPKEFMFKKSNWVTQKNTQYARPVYWFAILNP